MEVEIEGWRFELRYFIFQIGEPQSIDFKRIISDFRRLISDRGLQKQKPKFLDVGFAKLVVFMQSDQEKADGIYYTLSLRPL